MRPGLVVGKNVDSVDIEAGMRMARTCGFTPEADPNAWEVLNYALRRWQRGEEEGAERTILGIGREQGIDFTSWRMVLAAAAASQTVAGDE